MFLLVDFFGFQPLPRTTYHSVEPWSITRSSKSRPLLIWNCWYLNGFQSSCVILYLGTCIKLFSRGANCSMRVAMRKNLSEGQLIIYELLRYVLLSNFIHTAMHRYNCYGIIFERRGNKLYLFSTLLCQATDYDFHAWMTTGCVFKRTVCSANVAVGMKEFLSSRDLIV